TRIRSNYWVFQEKDAIFGSNQVVGAPRTSCASRIRTDPPSRGFSATSGGRLSFIPLSDVIIHREFVRVRPQSERVVFLLFHVDPVGDEGFVEDLAAQQEGMIDLKRFNRRAE